MRPEFLKLVLLENKSSVFPNSVFVLTFLNMEDPNGRNHARKQIRAGTHQLLHTCWCLSSWHRVITDTLLWVPVSPPVLVDFPEH